MAHKELTSSTALNYILTESLLKPQVIFKHSTRCFISSRVLKNTENCFDDPRADWHLLDLIAYRNISNDIENTLKVTHQSPQIIIVYKGDALYDASHEQIQPEAIFNKLDSITK